MLARQGKDRSLDAGIFLSVLFCFTGGKGHSPCAWRNANDDGQTPIESILSELSSYGFVTIGLDYEPLRNFKFLGAGVNKGFVSLVGCIEYQEGDR